MIAQRSPLRVRRAQGCAEIRWLAEKMGAKPTTVNGLSGLGDIMLTCYGSLSRNRRDPLPSPARQQLRDCFMRTGISFPC